MTSAVLLLEFRQGVMRPAGGYDPKLDQYIEAHDYFSLLKTARDLYRVATLRTPCSCSERYDKTLGIRVTDVCVGHRIERDFGALLGTP